MKLGRNLRHFLIALGLAVLAYGMTFGFIQHRRSAKGPWEVSFTSEAGVPILVVNQAKLDIRGVRIEFSKQTSPTNVTQTVWFAEGRTVPFDLPFGKCVFLDLLFLPGTVALEAFGHQIQFLPRALTIDRVEHPWRSGEAFILPAATNAVAQTP